MPMKHMKWGLKVLHNVLYGDIYLCKKERKKERNEFLLGDQVVLNLMSCLLNQNHHVYSDDFSDLFIS
jgi:hypothetical protein